MKMDRQNSLVVASALCGIVAIYGISTVGQEYLTETIAPTDWGPTGREGFIDETVEAIVFNYGDIRWPVIVEPNAKLEGEWAYLESDEENNLHFLFLSSEVSSPLEAELLIAHELAHAAHLEWYPGDEEHHGDNWGILYADIYKATWVDDYSTEWTAEER